MRRANRLALFNLPSSRAWTREEDNYLMFKAERYLADELATRLNRTVGAVKSRLKYFGWKEASDVYSVNKACKATGYAMTQLERARKSIHMTWRRNSKGHFAITPDQLTRMTDYLRDEGRDLNAL